MSSKDNLRIFLKLKNLYYNYFFEVLYFKTIL